MIRIVTDTLQDKTLEALELESQITNYLHRGGSIKQCPPCQHSYELRCRADPRKDQYGTTAVFKVRPGTYTPRPPQTTSARHEYVKQEGHRAARHAYQAARDKGMSIRDARAAASKARKAQMAVLNRGFRDADVNASV